MSNNNLCGQLLILFYLQLCVCLCGLVRNARARGSVFNHASFIRRLHVRASCAFVCMLFRVRVSSHYRYSGKPGDRVVVLYDYNPWISSPNEDPSNELRLAAGELRACACSSLSNLLPCSSYCCDNYCPRQSRLLPLLLLSVRLLRLLLFL